MDTIVKYNNQFNQVALRNFSSQELDLLISISSKVREKGTEIIEFSFFELKKYINLKSKHSNVEFMKNIINVNRKLLALNFTFINGNVIEQFTLFNKFKVDGDTQILYVSVNEEFFFLLNQLTSNFTRFELKEFVTLKSSYAKEFYRRMKQFRSTGFWKCNIEEFRNLLDIPEKYRIVDIDKYVLKPVVKELGEKYNLQIEKKYGFNGGRGRSRVIGFEFRFSTDKNLETLETKKIEKEVKPQKRYKIIENTPKVEEKEKTLSEQIKEELEMEQEALNRSTTLLGAYIAGLKDITNNSIIIDSKRRINLRKEKIEKLEQFSNLTDDEIDESLEKVIQKVLEMEIK
jgi:plasmid replication initiation protein